MKKYWLHRITGGDNALEFAHPLLFTHNYLTIGWSDFSSDSFVKDVKERGSEAIDKAMQEKEAYRSFCRLENTLCCSIGQIAG
jgi:hypothetical protein